MSLTSARRAATNHSTRVAFLLTSISKSRLSGSVQRLGTPLIAPQGRMDPTVPRACLTGASISSLSAESGDAWGEATDLDDLDGIPSGAKTWIYRFQIAGRRRDMAWGLPQYSRSRRHEKRPLLREGWSQREMIPSKRGGPIGWRRRPIRQKQ